MAHSIEELLVASAAVTSWAQLTDAKVFPSRLRTSGPETFWPMGRDLAPFLDLARNFSVPIVYATLWPFDSADHLALLAQAAAVDARDDDTDDETIDLKALQTLVETNAALASYSQELEESIDTPCIFSVQWVHMNVVHTFLVEAKWYKDIVSRAEEVSTQTEKAQEILIHEIETSLPIEAAKLANNPNFTSLAFVNQQRWVSELGLYKSFSLQYELVRKAREIFEREVVPQRERELVAKATELIRAGSSMAAAAAKLDLTPNRLRRLIHRYGEPSSSS